MATSKKATKDIAVDLDIGGTFTDCYISFEGGYTIGKSSTTKYDVSVGALRAIEVAAETIDLGLEELLDECVSVSYSTTISLNTLIERTGPKLGLITTEGFEDVTLIEPPWDSTNKISMTLNPFSFKKPINGNTE